MSQNKTSRASSVSFPPEGGTAAPMSYGWTCGKCAQWIPNGTTHACWAESSASPPPRIEVKLRLRTCPTCGSDDARYVRVQGRSKMPDGREMVGGFFTVIMASIYCPDVWHDIQERVDV